MSISSSSQAAKAVRRQLATRVRDDWAYEWPIHADGRSSEPRQSLSDGNASSRDAFDSSCILVAPATSKEAAYGPVEEWRERCYASSDLSPSETEMDLQGKGGQSSTAAKVKHPLDTPDGVADALEARRKERRLRRQKRLEEEAEWNDGLAHWIAQRDAWCCARRVEKASQPLDPPPPINGSAEEPDIAAHSSAARPQPQRASSRTSSSSSTMPTTTGTPVTASTVETPILTPSLSPSAETVPAPATTTTLLPIPAPLLPANHPARSPLTSAAATSHLRQTVYSKLVIQSLAPTVPINLASLVPALVAGWIKDGEWPPRPAAAAALAPSSLMTSAERDAARTAEIRSRIRSGGGIKSKSGKTALADGFAHHALLARKDGDCGNGGTRGDAGAAMFPVVGAGDSERAGLGRKGRRTLGQKAARLMGSRDGAGFAGLASPMPDDDDAASSELTSPISLTEKRRGVAKRLGRALRSSFNGPGFGVDGDGT